MSLYALVRPSTWLGILCLSSMPGCSGLHLAPPARPLAPTLASTPAQPLPRSLAAARQDAMARLSLVHWNAQCVDDPDGNAQWEPLRWISRCPFELDNLMAGRAAPELYELEGCWFVVHKGAVPAALGQSQEIKVFATDTDCPYGTTRFVQQVSVSQLASHGFRQERHSWLGRNADSFRVVASPSACQPLRLLYVRDPQNGNNRSSCIREDEIVRIDDGLLLGRSRMHLGHCTMTLGYYVLSRSHPGS